MEYAVKTRYSIIPIWLLGIVVLAISVAGTSLVLHTRAGDSAPKEDPYTPPAAANDGAVCIGHVDVEHRVRDLCPVQPGRVEEVLVQEDDAVKAGAVLLRLDDRPAQFLLRQAKADLQAAQSWLADAGKRPQQHQLQIAQQKQAIAAGKDPLAAAPNPHRPQPKLEKQGNLRSPAQRPPP